MSPDTILKLFTARGAYLYFEEDHLLIEFEKQQHKVYYQDVSLVEAFILKNILAEKYKSDRSLEDKKENSLEDALKDLLKNSKKDLH